MSPRNTGQDRRHDVSTHLITATNSKQWAATLDSSSSRECCTRCPRRASIRTEIANAPIGGILRGSAVSIRGFEHSVRFLAEAGFASSAIPTRSLLRMLPSCNKIACSLAPTRTRLFSSAPRSDRGSDLAYRRAPGHSPQAGALRTRCGIPLVWWIDPERRPRRSIEQGRPVQQLRADRYPRRRRDRARIFRFPWRTLFDF